ncbi:hypothetical protein SteCoe_27085 [Stentor coeruleus]|uniref:Uncharacterized protein n=1 Tax=Stentor coeruleus TaxID=5963 RepID=A0A1R2BBD9_9CILI|nr:hypothetical protein SteCoe_27085 [Stentor coeruleus]
MDLTEKIHRRNVPRLDLIELGIEDIKDLREHSGRIVRVRKSADFDANYDKENFKGLGNFPQTSKAEGVGMNKGVKIPLNPSSTRNLKRKEKNVDECIEEMDFKNRNLNEIVRIRMKEIRDRVIGKRIELSEGIDNIEKEVQGLQSKYDRLLFFKNLAIEKEEYEIFKSNELLMENIQYLKESINVILSTGIQPQVYTPLQNHLSSLTTYKTILLSTNSQFKSDLQDQLSLNSNSQTLKAFLKNIESIKEFYLQFKSINSVLVSKTKQPKNPFKKQNPNDPLSLLRKTLCKLRKIREKLSDKYAEKCAEGCQLS